MVNLRSGIFADKFSCKITSSMEGGKSLQLEGGGSMLVTKEKLSLSNNKYYDNLKNLSLKAI
jgi:hypothetical protein